jgi:serine/threonine protein kinase
MITRGKHAEIRLYEKQIRIFKTYKDSLYVDNEHFALSFLASQKIMNLHPKKESAHTISMDWIKETIQPDISNYKTRGHLRSQLSAYLKELHQLSFEKYGQYITHEDIFPDNVLKCCNTDKLIIIDWGLSKKRDNVYPDFASIIMGIFNEYPEDAAELITEYSGNLSNIDCELILRYVYELYEEYKNIRKSNNVEIKSLDSRLKQAINILNLLSG